MADAFDNMDPFDVPVVDALARMKSDAPEYMTRQFEQFKAASPEQREEYLFYMISFFFLNLRIICNSVGTQTIKDAMGDYYRKAN